eukprot:CAMPEP_0180020960 /NCGR_PEP_ID=MMETSP0984-20121128/22052_1 /TAXON_ID=483367 /ORGANISM="non described non described, Strain CCMP 2436" /LENGTH=41 /DNA_ID= /DNA_START= /DNA_END= /DNA_ORIENTATION=
MSRSARHPPPSATNQAPRRIDDDCPTRLHSESSMNALSAHH